MSHRLRIFGLAVAIALTSGALSAQAAFAIPEFTSFNTNTKLDEAAAVVKGAQTTEHEYTMSTGGTPIKCKTAGFSGKAVAASVNLTLAPSWGGCTANSGNNPVDVRVNGCEYKFSITAKDAADEYDGTYNIVCPAGQKIEFEVTTEFGALRKCLDTIDPQVGVGSATYFDNTKAAPADFTIKMAVTNLANTTDDNKAGCGVNQELHKDGKFSGTTTIQAENAKGEGIDFTVVG